MQKTEEAAVEVKGHLQNSKHQELEYPLTELKYLSCTDLSCLLDDSPDHCLSAQVRSRLKQVVSTLKSREMSTTEVKMGSEVSSNSNAQNNNKQQPVANTVPCASGEDEVTDVWDSSDDFDEQEEGRLVIDLNPDMQEDHSKAPQPTSSMCDEKSDSSMTDDQNGYAHPTNADEKVLISARSCSSSGESAGKFLGDVDAIMSDARFEDKHQMLQAYQRSSSKNYASDENLANQDVLLTAQSVRQTERETGIDWSNNQSKENECKENVMPHQRIKTDKEKNSNILARLSDNKILCAASNRTKTQPLTVSQSFSNKDGHNFEFPQQHTSTLASEPADQNSLRTNVIFKHAAIQQEFSKLARQKNSQVKQLEEYYKRQTAKIEAHRHDALCDVSYKISEKSFINQSFDRQRHNLIESVEKNLANLKVEDTNKMDVEISSPAQTSLSSKTEDAIVKKSEDIPLTSRIQIPDQGMDLHNKNPTNLTVNTIHEPSVDYSTQAFPFSPTSRSVTSSTEITPDYSEQKDNTQESPLDLSRTSSILSVSHNFNSLPSISTDPSLSPVPCEEGPLDLSMKTTAKEFLRAKILMHQQKKANENMNPLIMREMPVEQQTSVASENLQYAPLLPLPPPPQLIPSRFVFSQASMRPFDHTHRMPFKTKTDYETVSSTSTSPSDSLSPPSARGKAHARRVPYRRSLPPNATDVLMKWYVEHQDLPYPTPQEYQQLASSAAITQTQVKTWLANKRRRTYNTLAYNGCVHPKARERAAKAFRGRTKGSDDGHLTSSYNQSLQNQYDDSPICVQDSSAETPHEGEAVQRSQFNNNLPSLKLPVITCEHSASSIVSDMLSVHALDKLQKWLSQKGDRYFFTESEVRSLSEDLGLSEDTVRKWISERVHDYSTDQNPGKHFKRRSDSNRYLKPEATELLNSWYKSHEQHPYPTDKDKSDLAAQCGLTIAQVNCWFANKRNRNHNTRKKPLSELLDVLEQRQRMLSAVKNAMP